MEGRNSDSISLNTCIPSSYFLINQMKNISSELLKKINKYECSIDDEINNAIVEHFHFQIMSKLLHDFRLFTSCLKILYNPVLCLNMCSTLVTKKSIDIKHCQKCYVPLHKHGNDNANQFFKKCDVHNRHLKRNQNIKDANQMKRIEPTSTIKFTIMSPSSLAMRSKAMRNKKYFKK